MIHLAIYRYDHAPKLLKANTTSRYYGVDRLFKFEALWLSNDECGKVIKEAWRDSIGEEITSRLASCVDKLPSWAEATFSNIK